ncbi:hypothetical protein ACQPW3_13465 [Actinosynnema sp. CA-248983]
MTDPSPTTAEQPAAPDTGAAAPAPAPTAPPAPTPDATATVPAADTRVSELESRAQAAEDRARLAEQQLTRLTVARAAGLPDAFAARLQGADEAALTADATALVELIKTAAAPAAPTALAAPTPPAPAAAPLPPGRRPVESLTPAATTGTDAHDEPDTPDAIARAVFGGK